MCVCEWERESGQPTGCMWKPCFPQSRDNYIPKNGMAMPIPSQRRDGQPLVPCDAGQEWEAEVKSLTEYLLPTVWWIFHLVKTAQGDCCSSRLTHRRFRCLDPQPHRWADRSDSGHCLAACSFPGLAEGLLYSLDLVWTPFQRENESLTHFAWLFIDAHLPDSGNSRVSSQEMHLQAGTFQNWMGLWKWSGLLPSFDEWGSQRLRDLPKVLQVTGGERRLARGCPVPPSPTSSSSATSSVRPSQYKGDKRPLRWCLKASGAFWVLVSYPSFPSSFPPIHQTGIKHELIL